jgi:hypothetical protein
MNRLGGVAVALTVACVCMPVAGAAYAMLPDDRGYELVSPVEKSGVSPYAATPSVTGNAVNFQARGAFAAATWGSLNMYQSKRTAGGWQTAPLTPTPMEPLGMLEVQASVWFSSDLTQTIFTTPASYDPGDQNDGALDLYRRNAEAGVDWLSQGSQGGSKPNQATFDGATPDGSHVVFSSDTSLLSTALGLETGVFPDPEFLYERDIAGGETRLVSLDTGGHLVGNAESTLVAASSPGQERIIIRRTEGFLPGQFVTVGTGPSAETEQISAVTAIEATTEKLVFDRNLQTAFPAGTPVRHLSEGAILGDGGHLASGTPPASEYVPANTESGSTTNAVSADGSKVFFESPSPDRGQPVGLYMRQDDATTVQIAGTKPYGTTIAGLFPSEYKLFGSARFEGAAAGGSLSFFTSEEGLDGAAIGKEVYEFNSTAHEIGGVAPLSVSPVSVGLAGDKAPTTILTSTPALGDEAINVVSTTGFAVGETIAIGPFDVVEFGQTKHNSTFTREITSIKNGTELTFAPSAVGVGSGIPLGTAVHGVHPASVVAVANDGLRVYFESDGILATNANAEGVSAVAMRPNLYVFNTTSRSTTFVASLAEKDVLAEGVPTGLVGEPDVSRPAVPSPDGGVLVFLSAGDLTGQNPWEEFKEVYRYSVARNTLTCLSCTAPGIRPTGDANFGETPGGTYDPPGLSSSMSEDGSRVFFDSPDSLVPTDTNGAAPPSAKFGTPTSMDVYEWSVAGGVGLISSGQSSNPSTLQGTTPSGDDVLFTTTAQLVSQGVDGGFENVYDARVGGGFPAASGAGAPSCVGETCRFAFGVAPVSVVPASVFPQITGTAPVVKQKPTPGCRKGFVRKRVKRKLLCVRKKPSKAAHAKRSGRAARGVGTGGSGRVAGVGVHGSR